MSASLLFVNARLWSGAPMAADVLLVREGRIAAIGEGEALRARAPEATVIDGRGGTLTPGLIDAHLHFTPWARARRQPDLHGCGSRAEALERVAAALAGLPAGDAPLVGRGWDEGDWEAPPTRAALDALAPTRPVMLHRHDFHTLWVNSAALAAAGITPATPDPEGGRFERDAAGAFTGLVREHAVAAFTALEEQAAPTLEEALLDEAASALHAEGVTAVHDYQRNHDDWRRMRVLASRRRLRVLQMIGPEQLADRVALGLAAGRGMAGSARARSSCSPTARSVRAPRPCSNLTRMIRAAAWRCCRPRNCTRSSARPRRRASRSRSTPSGMPRCGTRSTRSRRIARPSRPCRCHRASSMSS
jgi:predicted amidohydrolase YtcJ